MELKSLEPSLQSLSKDCSVLWEAQYLRKTWLICSIDHFFCAAKEAAAAIAKFLFPRSSLFNQVRVQSRHSFGEVDNGSCIDRFLCQSRRG
jgi:hypothetical protein